MGWDIKRITLYLIAVIGLWAIGYIFVISPVRAQTGKLKQDLVNLQRKIKTGAAQGNIIDENTIKKIAEEKDQIKENLTKLTAQVLFTPRPDYQWNKQNPPPGDPLIYFTNRRTATLKQLYNAAAGLGIKIPLPSAFGFPDNVSPDDIPVYLMRLDMIEQFVSLALAKRCPEITRVVMDKKVTDFVDTSLLANKFIKCDPVMVELKANYKTAGELIYLLNGGMSDEKNGAGRFLAIPRISLHSENQKEDLLTITLAIGIVSKVQ